MLKTPKLLILGALLACLPALAKTPFEAVMDEVDTDGTLLFYYELDNDMAELGGLLNEAVAAARQAKGLEVPPVAVDFQVVFREFGLDAVRALGTSAKVEEEGLHVVKNFYLLDGAPRGIMALVGGEAQTFTAADHTPATADFVYETSLQLTALRDVIREIMKASMGAQGELLLNNALQSTLPNTTITGNQLLEKLSGWITLVLDMDAEVDATAVAADPLAMWTASKGYVRFQGAAEVFDGLKPLFEGQGLAITSDGDRQSVDLGAATGGLKALVVAKANDLYIVFGHTSFEEATNAAQPLSADPTFKKLMAKLPKKGTTLHYASADYMRTSSKMLPLMVKDRPDLQPLANVFMGYVDANAVATVATLWFTDSGLKSVAYSERSFKAQIGSTCVGVLGTLAIGAILEKAEASRAAEIEANLGIIYDAGQKYFAVDPEAESVAYLDLVAAGLIQNMPSIAGETYDEVVVTRDETWLHVTLPSGEEVTYVHGLDEYGPAGEEPAEQPEEEPSY